MKYLIILILAATLLSCHATQETMRIENTATDSTHVQVITKYRDTTINIAADSAAIRATVNCPDMPTRTKHSGRATLTTQIANGILTADCYCDSIKKALRLAENTITTYRQKTDKKITEKVRTKQVRFIPWWAKILAWIGGIMSFLVIIILVTKFSHFKI